jgi:hypothetical protein
MCGRERTITGMDAYDYSPLQAVAGSAFGWYSGDDGEICPEDMEKVMRGGGGPR